MTHYQMSKWLMLMSCWLMICQSAVVQASEIESEVGVEFVEESQPSQEPPLGPRLPKTKGKTQSKSDLRLPQTGEKVVSWRVSLVGSTLLISVLYLFKRREVL